MTQPVHDVLVVGSGAAGSYAARELTAQGLKVVLLEAGPDVSRKDFDPARIRGKSRDINLIERAVATMKGQPVQSRAVFFSGQLAHMYVNDRKHPYTTPKDAPFVWIRGRQAGGRLHVFGRVLLRWTDQDFKLRSRTGQGADWPVSYDDLVPFYEEVERHVGLYGNPDGVETLPDGIYRDAAPLTPQEELFRQKVEAAHPDQRVISWRYIGAEPNRQPRALQEARASGLLDMRCNAVVRRVLTDAETGRATGAEYLDRLSGKAHQVRARAVMLCASPIETVRLMLNSADAAHPDGLANSSGTLGRYFMDQLPSLTMGSFPLATGWATADLAPPDPFYPPSGGIFLPRATSRTEELDFDFQASVGRVPVAEGEAARMSFFGFGRMLPDAENRITLDPSRRDALGIPVPHIRLVPGEADKALLRRQQDRIATILADVGAQVDFTGSPLGLTEYGKGAFPGADPLSRMLFRKWFGKVMCMGAAIHETGGARMGASAETSVLNRWNQSWDVPNLYVTDASCFAGSGVSGTTLTIMALSLRAARHLAEALRAGRI